MTIIGHSNIKVLADLDEVNPRTGESDAQKTRVYRISGDVGYGFHGVTVHASDIDGIDHGRALIQDVFYYLSPGDREFLMTGIPPPAFADMAEEEEY